MLSHVHELSEEKAKELVRERACENLDKLTEITEKLRSSFAEIMIESGFRNVWDDDEYWIDD